LLLTEKRDGSLKCRAVVLGNQCEPTSEHLYAPVVSWVSLRSMLTQAARDGDFTVIQNRIEDKLSYNTLYRGPIRIPD
jgi:hypothetical protein